MTMIKGYCRVLYTILENIIGVCIVMKISVGRDAAGVESNASFQYNIWTVQYLSTLYITLYNNQFIIKLK